MHRSAPPCPMPANGGRRAASILLLLLLAQTIVGPAGAAVVVFQEGSGEQTLPPATYSGRTYVVVDQEPDGTVTETLITVEAWVGPTSSLGTLDPMNLLKLAFSPVSWVYHQLEAIDALQQATLNTFLMRSNEAMLEEQLAMAMDRQERKEQQGTADAAGEETGLRRPGCEHIKNNAMDDYDQQPWAAADAAFQAAQQLDHVLDSFDALVPRPSSDARDTLLLHEDIFLEELAAAAVLEQGHHASSVLREGLDPDGKGRTGARGDLVVEGGAGLVMSSGDMDDAAWGTVSEAVSASEEAHANDSAATLVLKHPHQQSHAQLWIHTQGLHPDADTGPGPSAILNIDDDVMLQLLSMGSLPEAMAEAGAAGGHRRHRARDPLLRGAPSEQWGKEQEALLRVVAAIVLQDQDEDSDDLYRPFFNLFADLSHQRPEAKDATDGAARHHDFPDFAADLNDMDLLPEIFLDDTIWDKLSMLVLLVLALAATGAAFVASWMQVQALLHRSCGGVPVMLNHGGRLVRALVVVSEDEARHGFQPLDAEPWGNDAGDTDPKARRSDKQACLSILVASDFSEEEKKGGKL